jgi:hypothetical protein
MITVIDGPTGSGKTFFMVNYLVKSDWKYGHKVYTNFPVWFDEEKTNIERWHILDELYHVENGIICIDEGQKLFDAHRWKGVPISFSEKIAQHRKHKLDIYTMTQDLGHIYKRFRDNIHNLYSCRSVFRYPKNERRKPALQIVQVIHKTRSVTSDNRVHWKITGRRKIYISKYWSKTYYNSYQDIGFNKVLCKIKHEKKRGVKTGKWTGKLYSREVINAGRARF